MNTWAAMDGVNGCGKKQKKNLIQKGVNYYHDWNCYKLKGKSFKGVKKTRQEVRKVLVGKE